MLDIRENPTLVIKEGPKSQDVINDLLKLKQLNCDPKFKDYLLSSKVRHVNGSSLVTVVRLFLAHFSPLTSQRSLKFW